MIYLENQKGLPFVGCSLAERDPQEKAAGELYGQAVSFIQRSNSASVESTLCVPSTVRSSPTL